MVISHKKLNMKKYFKYFLKEIIPVIFGILIALFLNSWNEKRKDKKYYNQVFESINKELVETKKEIDITLINQKKLLDSLEFYEENQELSIYDVIKKTNGFKIPFIKTSTWKAVSNTKIEILDFEDLSDLTGIEEGKNFLNDKVNYTINYVYSNIFEKSKEKKVQLNFLLSDIIDTEKSIKEDINKFLDDK